MSDLSWSVFQVWNNTVFKREDREIKRRDVIWASEIGGAFVDRWLKMKGEKPSNPPNIRSLRKFDAGNIWEWIVKTVFLRAGILQTYQKWVEYQYPKLLKVTGRLDFQAGGKPDYEKARAEFENGQYPEFITRSVRAIIDDLAAKYPDGLKEIVSEIKSASSFMFDRFEKYGNGNPHHRGQLFHALKAENLQEGHLIYVCKDDCRMVEIGVFNPSPDEVFYRADIEKMTNYFSSPQQPPLEPEVIFDEESGRFSKNWKVEYSQYLTRLYGYSEPENYRAKWDSEVAQWNRVLTRVVKGEKMTKLNLEVIEKIKPYFPSLELDRMVEVARKKGVSGEGGET